MVEFFPSTVGRSLAVYGEMKNTQAINRPRGEFIFYFLFFIRENHNGGISLSFRVKYVVCSPAKVALDLIEFPTTV